MIQSNAPDDAEQVTRDMRWEALMEGIKSADAEFHGHLLRCSTKMSRLWLAGDITVESSQPQNAFRGAVLHRLRWSGAHGSAQTSFPCACGFPTANVTGTSTREVVEHIAGCRKNGGPTVRHNW